MCSRFSFYFFYDHPAPRDLHSFPTRRSSDLPPMAAAPRVSLLGSTKLLTGSATEVSESRPTRSTELASGFGIDRKSTRLNSSHLGISYAVFCLKKKKKNKQHKN